MLIDVARFAAARPALLGHLRRRLPLAKPWDDQSLLNETFAGRWDRLPNSWNWKPYWGFRDDAAIVHFHGVKPEMARGLLRGTAAPDTDAEYRRLVALDPAAYAVYLVEYDDCLAGAHPAV